MRATPCPRTISRMRARALYRCLQHAMGAAAKVLAQDAEREQQREAGRRRRGRRQQVRGRTSARGRQAKKGKRRRGKQNGNGHRQWLATRGIDDHWRSARRAGVDLNGARERVSLPRCSRDCSEGLISRVGHLGERDAAPTGLELLGQGAYVSLFLSPNPPLSIYSLRSLAVL